MESKELTINPFAKSNPNLAGLAIGNAAIESERAIAEAQGALIVAKRFKRNTAEAFHECMETCKRKSFAETATYAFPRGGQTVSGPSIRLAEELARTWGNIDYGIRELSRNEGFSEMEAYAWDLETNTRSTQRFTVRHKGLNKQQTELKDERDIYERTANEGARRLRARILAILPPDLVDAAEAECKKTLAGENKEPIADRAKKVVAAFASLGVNATLIEARLGHSLTTAFPEEFAELQQIYVSIKDGMTRPSDWFGQAQVQAPAVATVAAALQKQEQAPAPQEKPKTARKSEPAPVLQDNTIDV